MCKPVFEVFTAEMAEKLKGYVAAGLVKAPVFVNVVFDQSECGRSFQEYAEKLLTIIGYFPEDWHWSVTRGGASHRPLPPWPSLWAAMSAPAWRIPFITVPACLPRTAPS